MQIVIAGASGFVGRALSRFLLDAGHRVTGLGTSKIHPLHSIDGFTWQIADTTRTGDWQTAIKDADAVVNLAGRTIFKRWTRAYKTQIVDSRILTTQNIVQAMRDENQILISTSAVGYYGDRGNETLSEYSPPGSGFLAHLAVDWEKAALGAQKNGVRVAIMRFGVVLGMGGGALAQMLPVFRMFAGGRLGRGRQWFSWIHLADLLMGVQFLLDHDHLQGVYNFCAPEAVRQRDFARALGAALSRPALLPTPALALRLAMGEMGDVLLTSQRVRPDRLAADGFAFRFGRVDAALSNLVGGS